MKIIALKILKVTAHLSLFIFLTLLTQIGGLIYFIALFSFKYIDRYFRSRKVRNSVKLISFPFIYLITSFFIVPPLASLSGRVPLPLTLENGLKPLTIWTCVLNRHYVNPDLYNAVMNVSGKMHKAFPGTQINYLDANFPFINSFPLIPHLSHNDGKKLDLSFCYKEKATGKESNSNPSPIGYGVCEEPKDGEENSADFCEKKGYWQYSFLTNIIPQEGKEKLELDEKRTQSLVDFFSEENSIGKIFIEPYLKKRLELNSQKIRFHGCQAVRHDDHIHIQLK